MTKGLEVKNEQDLEPSAATESMEADARQGWPKKLAIGALALAVLAGVAMWLGPQLGTEIVALEQWIARQGVWGPVMFAGAIVLLTLVFIPDSLMAAAAGALFGMALGVATTIVGVVTAQCIAFGLSRHFLHDRVHNALSDRPKLLAIEQAANREGLRLQFLLRLTPLNPVAVSHVIGITRVRFRSFLIACVGLIPGLFVEVYLGYTAKHLLKVSGHVSEHSTLHTVLTVSGLLVCMLLLAYVTRLARNALAESEQLQPEPTPSGLVL